MDREFTNRRREFATYESAANESAAKTVLVDCEALDLRFQRGGGHAELGGSPASPRNPAAAFREHGFDELLLVLAKVAWGRRLGFARFHLGSWRSFGTLWADV